jgi:hypothetical protein
LTGRLKSITEEELGYLGSLDQNLKMLESELNKEEPDSIKVRLITSKLQGNASDLNSLIKKYNLSP